MHLSDRLNSLLENRKDSSLDPDPAIDTPLKSLAVAGVAVAAGMVTRRGCKELWSRYRGEDPPVNPAAPGVSWADALTWAVAVGAAAGVARVISRRGTAAAARRLS